jgi:hypothetical protein
VRHAPGFPCALCFLGRVFLHDSEVIASRECGRVLVIASVSEAIQPFCLLDCFVAFAPRNDAKAGHRTSRCRGNVVVRLFFSLAPFLRGEGWGEGLF